MSAPSGFGSQKGRKGYLSGKPTVPSKRSQEILPVTAQPDQRLPVAPPISDNTPQQSSTNDDQQQAQNVATAHVTESEHPFSLPTLPSQRSNSQNIIPDPFKSQALPGESSNTLDGSPLPQNIWRPQSYAKYSNTRNDGAAHGTPLNPDIWKPQSYARDGDSNGHGSGLFTPTPNPRGASSRMGDVSSNQQIPPLAHAVPSTNNRFAQQRLPPLAPAAPKPNMAYSPRLSSSSEANQPANVRSAPRFPKPPQPNPTANISSGPRQPLSTPAISQNPLSTQDVPHPNINSAAQPPTQAPTTTLDYIPSEKAEELRDRLFKLTSDYQRLYGVFMSSGDASPHAARWNSTDINLPYLFEVRQQLINFLAATRRFENGEEIEDVPGFKASQKPFFKNLEETVGAAVEKVTWLRRDLEGEDGHAYQHRNWYYQVIGNNPWSAGLPPVEKDEEVEGKEGGDAGDGGDGESIDKSPRYGDEHGNLVSPSLDSEDEREMRAEKDMKM
ncbi:hypothetical protein EAE96_002861 [Botrytis aclada]|nr:hypothetical protein EAE96_002861 [Botrytis aclada]